MLQYRWNGSFHSKILQNAREMDRTTYPNKKREKSNSQNNSGPFSQNNVQRMPKIIWFGYKDAHENVMVNDHISLL